MHATNKGYHGSRSLSQHFFAVALPLGPYAFVLLQGFDLKMPNGVVSYAAPSRWPKRFFVNEAQSHACEWCRPSSENQVTPAAAALALLASTRLTKPTLVASNNQERGYHFHYQF